MNPVPVYGRLRAGGASGVPGRGTPCALRAHGTAPADVRRKEDRAGYSLCAATRQGMCLTSARHPGDGLSWPRVRGSTRSAVAPYRRHSRERAARFFFGGMVAAALWPRSASTSRVRRPASGGMACGLSPAGERELQRIARRVDQHMPLRPEAAARAAPPPRRLIPVSWGAPAAQACARTTVASIITACRSEPSATPASRHPRTPGSSQGAKRLYTLFHPPYAAGRNRHRAPPRHTGRLAPRTRRIASRRCV